MKGDETDSSRAPVQDILYPADCLRPVGSGLGVTGVIPADLIVLTVDALKVAVGEKDVTDPVFPGIMVALLPDGGRSRQ